MYKPNTINVRPSSYAKIFNCPFPKLTGARFEEVRITVELFCNGCEEDVEVTWTRAFPKEEMPHLDSEWDTPAFNIPSWGQCAGTMTTADKMRAYESMLDITDQFHDFYLKGK